MISGYRLNNLRFADDIVAICNSNQGLDTIVTGMATETRRMGVNINTDKTETQLIGRYRGSCAIKLEGQVLSHVEDIVYLGGLISSTSSSQPDVGRRIGLACDLETEAHEFGTVCRAANTDVGHLTSASNI